MRFAMFTVLALACLLAGCGSDAPGAPTGTGGSTSACPTGHVVGPDGACMPVGIQGCAELFIEEDGLCHPSMEKCPAGSIPGFDTGCVSVGIPGCAAVFLEDDGLCHPSMDKCPEGTFGVPTEGCVPVDGPEGCGNGTWGNIPDGPDTVWVDPSYQGGDGDGSQQKPVTSIAGAMFVVPKGGRIALAAGHYDEPVSITKPLELVGRCPSMVTIGGTTTDFGGPVIVAVSKTTGATIRGVRIAGAEQGVTGVLVEDAEATVQGSVVKGCSELGVVALGPKTVVTVERSLVEGTPATDEQPAQGLGAGLGAAYGASLAVVASAIVGSAGYGLVGDDPDTTVTVERSLVAGPEPGAGKQDGGFGLFVAGGADLALVASAVVHGLRYGLLISGPGTTVAVEQSLVAGTRSPGSQPSMSGISSEDATVKVVASAIVDNHGGGVFALGGTVEVEQSLVARSQLEESAQMGGYGVTAGNGAAVTVTASAIVENHSVGMHALQGGTTVDVERSLVAGTEPWPDAQLGELGGNGISATDGASITVVASAVVDNHLAGVSAGPGATLAMDHCLVEGTRPVTSERWGGNGVVAIGGANVAVVACAVVQNHEVGVAAGGVLTTLSVAGSLVGETMPWPDGSYGVGLACTDGADVMLSGSVVRASQTAGVMAVIDASLSLADALVDGVAPGKFYLMDPMTLEILKTFDGISDGVIVAFGSSATLGDTRVTGCARAGFVFDTSSGLLSGVSTEGGRYGLVAQGEPKPDWSDPGNAFKGTELPILTDGDLPVPGPPPIPEE